MNLYQFSKQIPKLHLNSPTLKKDDGALCSRGNTPYDRYQNSNDQLGKDQEAAKATKPGVLPEAAAPDFSYICAATIESVITATFFSG